MIYHLCEIYSDVSNLLSLLCFAGTATDLATSFVLEQPKVLKLLLQRGTARARLSELSLALDLI